MLAMCAMHVKLSDRTRKIVAYITAVAGLVIFSSAFIAYVSGDYKSFLATSAWHAGGNTKAAFDAFVASGFRFMFRLGYVLGFVGLFFLRRGAVYLVLIAWLGQLIPAVMYSLYEGYGLNAGHYSSFGSLVVFLGLVSIFWPVLKTKRSLLFCAAGLAAAFLLHCVFFALIFLPARPVAQTNDPAKQGQFMQAVIDGDAAKVKSMLADKSFHPALRGANCDSNTICNLISYAVDEKGSVEVVQMLKEAGSPVDEPDGGTGDTPLMRALFAGRTDIAVYLAAHGANPLTTNRFGVPEFIVAAGEGSSQLLEVMIYLTAATTVNMRQTMPDMLAGEAAIEKHQVAEVRGVTPLMLAAYYGRDDLIKTLLAHGADPALADEKGRRIYDYISAGKKPEIADAVRALVNNQPKQ